MPVRLRPMQGDQRRPPPRPRSSSQFTARSSLCTHRRCARLTRPATCRMVLAGHGCV